MFKIIPGRKAGIQVKTRLFALAAAIVLSPIVLPGAQIQAAFAAASMHADMGLDAKTFHLIDTGDWAHAIESLESLTAGESEPSRLDAWLAFAYLFQNKCGQAKKLAERVAGLKTGNDNQLEAGVVQAFSLICDGKLDEADKILQKLAADHADDALLNFALAAAAGKHGQAVDAVRYCQKTVELEPDFAWGYRTLGFLQDRWLKDHVQAQSNFEKALKLEPNFAEARDLLVDVHLIRNDFDGAIDAAEAGIKANPRNAGNYYRLAEIYTQQWRLKEAVQQLRKAIKLAPDQSKYHRATAVILRYQGQYDQALKEQQAAVDLSNDKAFELVEMASLNLLADKVDAAADNLRDALKLDPDNDAAHQKLAQILTQEKKYAELVDEYKRASARKPKDVGLHLGLAHALRLAGRDDEAVVELKETANLNPQDPQPHRDLAVLFSDKKDYDAAAREYTRALNINPSSVEDLAALGSCYIRNGDYLQSEAALVTAIALQQLGGPQPNSQINHLDLMRSLAELLLKEGRYADAASQLEAVCASSKTAANNPYDQFVLAEAKALRDRTDAGASLMLQAFAGLSPEQKARQRYVLVESLLSSGKPDPALVLLGQLKPESAPSRDDILSAIRQSPGWGQWDEKDDIRFLIDSSRAWQLKGDAGKAHDLASQAVAVKSDDAGKQSDAQAQLASVLLDRSNLDGAEAAVRKVLEYNAKSCAAYELWGRLGLKKNDRNQASAFGKKALEINPYFVRAYMLLGDVSAASGNWKEAADNYRKSVELQPGMIEAHKSLLDACKKLGLKEEAQKEEEQISQIEKRLGGPPH